MRNTNKYVVIIVTALLGLSVISARANTGSFVLIAFMFAPLVFAWRALSSDASKTIVRWAKRINLVFAVVASLSIIAALSLARDLDIGSGLIGMLPMILITILYCLNALALAKQSSALEDRTPKQSNEAAP